MKLQEKSCRYKIWTHKCKDPYYEIYTHNYKKQSKLQEQIQEKDKGHKYEKVIFYILYMLQLQEHILNYETKGHKYKNWQQLKKKKRDR